MRFFCVFSETFNSVGIFQCRYSRRAEPSNRQIKKAKLCFYLLTILYRTINLFYYTQKNNSNLQKYIKNTIKIYKILQNSNIYLVILILYLNIHLALFSLYELFSTILSNFYFSTPLRYAISNKSI